MSGSTSEGCPVERAVRMVYEIRSDHESEWAAMAQVGQLLWVGRRRQSARDAPAVRGRRRQGGRGRSMMSRSSAAAQAGERRTEACQPDLAKRFGTTSVPVASYRGALALKGWPVLVGGGVAARWSLKGRVALRPGAPRASGGWFKQTTAVALIRPVEASGKGRAWATSLLGVRRCRG